jgi:hydrogenase maturation protein HypF
MPERRAIAVGGIVQGVGFRPFVHGLASRLGLRGFVRNQTGGVLIEIEGEGRSLDDFLAELSSAPPPLAQIEQVSWEPLAARGDREFVIERSDGGTTGSIFISPDVATCADCLRELFDPGDRRHLYPFLNCTNCGPRLTIVTGAPYDRERTTMAGFALCAACRAEYEDPANRRFHAQPTACRDCGPALAVLDREGKQRPGEPVAVFAAALQAGQIGALKGLGGYHLACDAGNDQAVAELRRRKHRDEKPFALMVRDLEAAEALCAIGPRERELLLSPRRPIVLMRKRGAGCLAAGQVDNLPHVNGSRPVSRVAEGVAPGNHLLGIMLPYTPMHYLLFRALGDLPLVMTSGNQSDEPIAYRDDDALERLGGIADVFLVHNRSIHVRCEDSVVRVVDEAPLPVRRSRGYAPQAIRLPLPCPVPILAVGGQLKGAFALGRERHAFLSHHLGDLDHFEAYRAFVRDIALYENLFATRPQLLAHDLHPDYASSRHAQEGRPDDLGRHLRLLPVQHHHAHMASCMAEHGLDEPVIGVTFDGTGLGTDGMIWGGEFLIGDYRQFRRGAHLRYVGMPGGDQAIRTPWRMAIAHLRDADCECAALTERRAAPEVRIISKMLERRLNTPLTSSAGRLFDAVAALAGVRDQVTFEGQAAMELEGLATKSEYDEPYAFELLQSSATMEREPLVIDTRPLIRAVAGDADRQVDARTIAARFHATLVEVILSVCQRLRRATGLGAVVLSGGVFLNALLTSRTCARLKDAGFRVYRHRLVPPNDGGLSLGQLAIAAAQTASAGE